MNEKLKSEIFSYHLIKLPFFKALTLFFFPPSKKTVAGLKYSLCLFTMNLGQAIFLLSRYKFNTLSFIALWENEGSLEQFLLETSPLLSGPNTWHIRMKPYRRWGSLRGLNDAHLFEELTLPKGPVVGLTIAKLKLSQVCRFTKWGKPVEKQVHMHKGKRLAVVSMRPLQMFSTFSVWDNESEMLNMVAGNTRYSGGMCHKDAMEERARKSFHHEFTTMRFLPYKEVGTFSGSSGFLEKSNSV